MGNIQVQVTSDSIDLNKVIHWTPDSKHGAGNIFMGYVRSLNLGRDVIAVEYECYIPLCLKTFQKIAEEALEKWGDDTNIFIVHRHGRLNVGEASVAIAATTRHRDESYRVSRYIIEEIKTRAPIWKKEFYTDGETDWVRGHALCQHRKVDHHENSGNHSCGGTLHAHGTR
ncbi:MAG: molybdenum cofactor biosynthesis protein MoaE [Pseudobdellovibrionaceae bacterium]